MCLILEGSEPSEGQSSLWVSVFILQREGRATRLLGEFLLLSLWGCDSSQLCIQHQVRAPPRALRCVSLPDTGRCSQRALWTESEQWVPLGRGSGVSGGVAGLQCPSRDPGKQTGAESVQH